MPALIRGIDPLTIDSKAVVTMNTPGVGEFTLNGHQIRTCAGAEAEKNKNKITDGQSTGASLLGFSFRR